MDLALPRLGHSVRLEARVVQVIEPRKLAGNRTAGGMGLELKDPERVLRELATLVASLER